MWHDARTCGALLRQFHKLEVLRIEQAGIKSHLRHRTSQTCYGECHITLHLASAHLCIHHVVVHRVEAQEICRHLTVERE